MSLSRPPPLPITGASFSLGIVAARYNAPLVDALLKNVIAELRAGGVTERRLKVVRVPGSHEVPVAAQWLAQTGRHDGVIALGVLIAGNTNHHEMVGQSVSHALQQVAVSTGTPVINGVIVANNARQAEARCRGALNRGAEFARAMLEMAALKRALGGRS
jgi:6,7-dimethyl-8-ribityllumazine synthase